MKQAWRTFITSSDLIVIAGKNSQQNDKIVKIAKKQDIILHTAARGSPFCIIHAGKSKIDKQSIKEAAIFCASFSKAWKQGKKIIEIHTFKPQDTYKRKGMAQGTYGVKRIQKKFRIKPELAIGIKQGKLQCSPASALDKAYITIKQGKQSKEKAAENIHNTLSKKSIKTTKEKIMQLIPPGGFLIKF